MPICIDPEDWQDVVRSYQSACGAVIERFDGHVVEQLIACADGVPLYTEELTRAVTELGPESSAAAIPVTLQDSLLARLERLSSAKDVAQWEAVLGREFPYGLLAAIADCDQAALRMGLTRLVEAELVFVRGEPPDATYTFKHALVHEAAYESLLKRTRQQLHGRIADALMTLFPKRANAEPELVARHAEAAGRIDDAIAEYRRASEQVRALRLRGSDGAPAARPRAPGQTRDHC